MDAIQVMGLLVAFLTGMMVSNATTDTQRLFVIVVILAVIIALISSISKGNQGWFGRW